VSVSHRCAASTGRFRKWKPGRPRSGRRSPRFSAIEEPGDDDLAFQATLITEHDDLEKVAAPVRKRLEDVTRIMRAAQDPANLERTVRTPELVTNNVIGADPFRDLDRVRQNWSNRLRFVAVRSTRSKPTPSAVSSASRTQRTRLRRRRTSSPVRRRWRSTFC